MINLTLWLRQGQQVIPGIFSLRTSLRYAFLLGVSCYLFLIIFQPFGTYNFEDSSKYLLLAGYGGIFAFSYLLISAFLSNGKEWTVRKEYLRMLLVYISASMLNFLYNSSIVSQVPMQWINLLYMGLYTLSLYVPIGLIYFLTITYTNRAKTTVPVANSASLKSAPSVSVQASLSEQSNNISQNPTSPRPKCLTDQFTVISEYNTIVSLPNGSQRIDFGRQDFIFAKSMDNYCIVYFYEGKKVKKEIVRITLGKLAELLTGANIHRCHRSYLVNLDKVLSKEGNAQGFVLRFGDMDEYALVSRSMLHSVKSYLLN
ncbi:LytTR family transcriptional regulator [Sphingobacterium sp. ML3W]|uniref:LytTR family DNA-binding domain-containing protein n=1 Tax=Sphingobacterium sp. ML3W TaxID=1538644 RepID=UPI00249A2EED|nr:LytTR family DNA-binding domain-containing protein [Sphingobacterium sp. ML3W]WFA78386.1 LytTR family transcriptional regulator [Sphingobacterium sp. ML3W]